jgi:CRP-like cAMP-binding protein
MYTTQQYQVATNISVHLQSRPFHSAQAAGSSDWNSPLSEITAGGSVGEFSLIGRGDQTHQTTCVALEDDTEVFFLSRAVFAQFSQRYPLEFTAFVRTAVARLWRVASYTLQDFLRLPETSRDQHVRSSSKSHLPV